MNEPVVDDELKDTNRLELIWAACGVEHKRNNTDDKRIWDRNTKHRPPKPIIRERNERNITPTPSPPPSPSDLSPLSIAKFQKHTNIGTLFDINQLLYNGLRDK